VGQDVGEDQRRLRIVREEVGFGPDIKLMVDANQRWEVTEAVQYRDN